VKHNSKLSDVAWSLITQLLEKNLWNRIGYKYGSNPFIREHQFFQSINWDQLEQRNIKPPWNPRKAIFIECKKKMKKQQGKSSPACESSAESSKKNSSASISCSASRVSAC